MALNQSLVIVTPVGRFVQGDVWTGNPNDMQGRARPSGPQWYVGLACLKGPEWDTFWQQVVAKAQADWPQGQWQLPAFAWKLVDGDDPKHAAKEGFPGHYILRLASNYAPRVVDSQPVPQPIPAPAIDLATGRRLPSDVERGCYLQVQVGIVGNDNVEKPGVYLNLGLTMRVGYGSAIQSGPPPEQVFAQRGALPAGASQVPVAQPAGAAVPAAAAVPGQPVPQPATGTVPGQPAAAGPGMVPAQPAPVAGAIPGQPNAAAGAVPPTAVPGAPAAIPGAVGAPAAVPGQPAPVAGAVPGQPVAGAPQVAVGVPGAVPGAAGVVPNAGFLQPGQPGYVPPVA